MINIRKRVDMAEKFLEHKKIKAYMEITPLYLSHSLQRDVLVFRRIIEIAHRQGLWWGILGIS
jgi:hypothetical protein